MKAAKQNSLEVSGAIARYTTNKHNDIDGLIIDQQGTLVKVNFPPHTARFVRETAVEGDTVQLVLHEKPHPHGDGHPKSASRLHLATIENTGTNQQFSVESIKPPHPSETGRLVHFSIPKPQFTRDGKAGKGNHITGIIFEDKFIHLHPDEYEEEENALASAAVLLIKAKKRIVNAGFINADGHAVYHAHSINIGQK